jgi:hypothetical protein
MFGWTIWVSPLAFPDIDDGMMKRPAQLQSEASHAIHSKHAVRAPERALGCIADWPSDWLLRTFVTAI